MKTTPLVVVLISRQYCQSFDKCFLLENKKVYFDVLSAFEKLTFRFVFFYRKGDSEVFQLQPTLSNLVQFVLARSRTSLRLQASVGVCSVNCVARNAKLAVARLRDLHNEVAALRSRTLRAQQRFTEIRSCLERDSANHLRDDITRLEEKDYTFLFEYHARLRRRVREKEALSHRVKRLLRILTDARGSKLNLADLAELGNNKQLNPEAMQVSPIDNDAASHNRPIRDEL